MVRRSLLVGLVAAAMGLSACSSAGTGIPGDLPSKGGDAGPSSTGGSASPSGGAPKVAHPVDTAKYRSAPCSAVSQKEIKNLGLKVKPTSDPTGKPGPSCTYPGGADGISVNWAFINGNGGLGTIYSKKADFSRFQRQTDVNDFPAVVAIAKPDPGPSRCIYWIGASDDDAVFVSVDEPNYKQNHADVCHDARQVALGLTNTITTGG